MFFVSVESLVGNSKGRGDNSFMGYILDAAWDFQTKVYCLAIFRTQLAF